MTARLTRRALCASFLVLASGSAGLADPVILSAPDAYAELSRGRLVLLDIRRPSEWATTGVARGAWPVSIHHKDFSSQLQAILRAYPADQIAVICATGGRSKHLTDLLVQNRITGVRDVSEGMLGNRRGPGWVARQLPVVSHTEALAAYKDVAKDFALD